MRTIDLIVDGPDDEGAISRRSRTFRIATSDYLGAEFISNIARNFRALAPNSRLEFFPLDKPDVLASSLMRCDLDMVIANFCIPGEAIERKVLFEDEIMFVCRRGLFRDIGPSLEQYVAAKHLSVLNPTSIKDSIIDDILRRFGLDRKVVVFVPYFNRVPDILERSDLVFTTTRTLATQWRATYDLDILPLYCIKERVEYARFSSLDRESPQSLHWLIRLIDSEASKVRR